MAIDVAFSRVAILIECIFIAYIARVVIISNNCLIIKPVLWISQQFQVCNFIILDEKVQVLRVVVKVDANKAEGKVVENFKPLITKNSTMNLAWLLVENVVEQSSDVIKQSIDSKDTSHEGSHIVSFDQVTLNLPSYQHHNKLDN